MPRPLASPSPPASFPFMSGNFDFPHASTSSPTPPRSLEALESLEIARREHERINRPSATEDSLMPPRRPRVEPSRRRQLRRTLPSDRESRESGESYLAPPRLPRPSSSNRPRATPSERYLRRSNARLREQRSADIDSAADALDSMSDIPVPNPFVMANPSTRPRSPISELDGVRRQTKRRKIEHDSNMTSPYDGFKYGHKGQVVPGRLKMEILSCDGGEYDKHSAYGLYPIQNVLKNDKSVYCSERSRCNLLLKHIGEMPFTLEKIIIRAPDRGFTAPIQEGLIFVSMSSGDLLSKTSSYKIEYGSPSPPRLSPAPSSLGNHQVSLREAVDDPYIWEHSRQGIQEAMEEQIERLRLRSRRLQVESSVRSSRNRGREDRQSALAEDDAFAENCDEPGDESYATAAGVLAPTPPPFTITTETDEESEEHEELPSAAIMADRLRRESRWRGESDDEEDGASSMPALRRSYALDSMENYSEHRWRLERHIEPIRALRRQTPSRFEAGDAQSEPEGLIAPHAKFFIAKHKNKITINFHPAVSGKFILLKLWSPTHDGNIDIESVQFYGFSGPRFFPAIKLR